MASLLDLPPSHPLIRQAVLDARSLVTARMAVTAENPEPAAVFDQLIREMVCGAVTPAAGSTPGVPLVLYGAQLAALASVAASAIKLHADANDVPAEVLRSVLFRVLDEMGETF